MPETARAAPQSIKIQTDIMSILRFMSVPFLLPASHSSYLSAGFSLAVRIAAAAILMASPGKNGNTHEISAAQSGVDVLIMNQAVPKA